MNFLPQSEFHKYVKQVHNFIDEHVAKAIKYSKPQLIQRDSLPDVEKKKERYILLHELGKTTNGKTLLRGELLTIFFAGSDTVASLLCSLLFILARRPDIWGKLCTEVSELKGRKPSFEELNRMSYVRYCVNKGKYQSWL